MDTKPARFTILIDADKKKAFDELCAAQDMTSSQVVRQLIKQYLERHGAGQGADAARSGRRRASGAWSPSRHRGTAQQMPFALNAN